MVYYNNYPATCNGLAARAPAGSSPNPLFNQSVDQKNLYRASYIVLNGSA